MLKKILTAFLYLIVIAAISAIIIGAFILLDKPIEQALIVIGALLVTFILILAIRTIIIKYKARQQVKRILQEEAVDKLSKAGETEKTLIKKLSANWRLAIKAIRSSQLKLRGNPLYVLPWYVVLGKQSSGKSTSLRNAKLITPKTELPEHDKKPTQNIDWWLYEEAIVIDTAGRYSMPEHDSRDRKEWKSLLKKIARHKQKEPLSGIVLTVSAQSLLSENEDMLIEEGRHIRASLTDLMKTLEAKPPVFLMVTKCDLIPGFIDWCQYLPHQLLRQSMGSLNESESGSLDEVIDDSLNSVLTRMKELRLLMLERSDNADDSLLTLPVEMEKLRHGIHSFANTALKDNLYQESPFFRGIYFTSSTLTHDSENTDESTETAGFLNHFFTQILPSHRGMTDNLAAAVRIRNAIKAFAISTSGLVTLGAVLFFASIYSQNTKTLEKIKNSYDTINVNQEIPLNEVAQLRLLKDLIDTLDEAQNEWVVPWNGSTSRASQIQELVKLYTTQFKKKVLSRIDDPLKKKIQSLDKNETSTIAGGIVRRINMLNLRLANSSDNHNKELPVIPSEYVVDIDHAMTQESAAYFDELYKSYIIWNESTAELQDEKSKLQAALLVLLEKNQGDYEWIIDWANEQGGDPVRLEDFWGGNDAFAENEPYVPVAYTLEGRDLINQFMEELRLASNKNTALTKIMNNFDEYYEHKYVKSWLEFARRFDEGEKVLHDRKDWLNSVERMSNDSNPYFSLLNRMHAALEPIKYTDEYLSKDVVDYFYDVSNYASPDEGADNAGKSKLALKALGKVGKVGKIAAKSGRKGMKVKKIMTGKSKEQLDEVIDKASESYQQYKKSLVAISFSADSSADSMSSLTTEFTKPDDPGSGEGPLSDAEKSVTNLQMLVGKPDVNTKLFWDLYTGPIRVAREYMRQETSCHLQDLWDKSVLAELDGVAQNKISAALIGDGGLVWKYIDDNAKPFLNKGQLSGYHPAQANGMSIPWTSDFLSFVNNGSVGKNIVNGEYDVTISSLPTGVNQTAQVSPYSTILELRCADGVQTLSNYNYNSSNEFKWSLEKCGDVSLSISIGQVTLRKEYKGEKGFPQFLKEFRDGHKVFVIDRDFPEYTQQLHNVNVYAIDVNYQIKGQEPLLNILSTAPMSAPLKVAKCWQ